MEAAGVAEAREMLVVSGVAVEEVGWELRMWAVMEVLMAEAAEVEAQDLLEEWLEAVEVVEVVVTQEMMHRLLVGLVVAEHVGWKVLNF